MSHQSANPAQPPRLGPRQPHPLKGIMLKLISVLVFTIMAALLKATAPEVPAGQQVFFRSFFALPVILAWVIWRGELRVGLRVADPLSHVWRGVAGSIAMGCSFAGLGLLPFPEATALGYAMPLLTVVFAAMFLGERVGWFRLSMVMMGMGGVMLVLSPRFGVSAETVTVYQTLGAVMTLAGATFGALAQVFIRKMVDDERTSAIVFWFSVTATILSLATLPFGWVIPDAGTTAVLVLIGLLGGVGQILLTSSYRFADASVVAPFEYSSMVMALLIGWFVFGEGMSGLMAFGAAIIMAAGIAIILRERRLGLERARARKAAPPRTL